MSKAFVDTTIVTDYLLNSGPIRERDRNGLARYDATELPVYAIKEFKAGPLRNFRWFYNKLALLGSYAKALEALQQMALTPQRYTTATAIQALKTAAARIGPLNLQHLVGRYGQVATVDRVLCDQYRLTLKAMIHRAWKRRRQLTSAVVCELSCYKEVAPYDDEQGLIKIDPTGCQYEKECCLADALRQRVDDLEKLRNVILQQPRKRENERRAQALRQLIRKPKSPVTQKICRDLGDAYFALFSPGDSVVLTTNTADHKPLAEALGKRAEAP